MATSPSLTVCLYLAYSRHGNISVADCMPVSSLLKTVKINGDVECTWCMTKQQSVIGGCRVHRRLTDINTVSMTMSPAIHKTTDAWHSHASVVLCLSQMMLQKCYIFLLIMDSPGGGLPATAP